MGFSFVQSKSALNAATAPAATFTNAPASGNLLVAAVYSGTNAVITMSSTGWTALTSIATGATSSQVACRLFWKIALSGESATVTATTGTGAGICIAEYDVLDYAVAVAAENAQSNVAGAAQSTPSVTPKGGLPMLMCCFAGVRGTTASFSAETIGGSGANEREDTNASATTTVNMCYYDLITVTSGAAYNGTATSAQTNVVGGGGIAVFTFAAPPLNNYQSVKVGDGMSTSEKIR